MTLLRARIDALTGALTPDGIQRGITDVEHVLLCDLLTGAEEADVLRRASADGLCTRSRAVFCPFETTLENQMARRVLEGVGSAVSLMGSLSGHYLCRYRALAASEIALAGIESDDRVLFIGSGPFPITAIEYARQAGASVDCVDHLSAATSIAFDVIRHLGLTSLLHPIHACGQDCPVEEYDVILVGVLAQPKAEILAHLDRDARPGCRVLCRTAIGLREFVYPRTTPCQLSKIGPAGFSKARGDQVISTQLLTADGAASGWEDAQLVLVRAPAGKTTC